MIYVAAQDVKIPALGLGTWQLRDSQCVEAVQTALHAGYRHIDTAQIYENESEVGSAIAASGVARSEIFLTTKIWHEHLRPADVAATLDESLRKLRSDYVDLLLIHWPVDDVPLADTLGALQQAQQQGKTRLIGVSNFTTAHLRHCVEELGAPIVNNQVEYHPYLSQQPVLDYLRRHGMFLTAYCPLGRAQLLEDTTLQAIARHHGKTVGQVILRWHVQQPDVVAIPKSGTRAHIEQNIAIFDFALSEQEMAAITALTHKNQRLINPDFAPDWDMPTA